MQQIQTASEPHRGPALRRGKSLTPINTTFEPKPVTKLQRLQRPRPIETVIYEKPTGPDPPDANTPHLQRRLSKGGLRGLFTRSKSANDVKANTRLASTIQEDDIPDVPIVKMATPSVKSSTGKRKSVTLEPPPQMPTAPAPNFQTQTLASKNKAKPALKEREEPARSLRNWNPPPLFQAYPQSVKHSHLAAPTASIDTILKIDKGRRTSGLNDSVSEHPPKLNLDESADSDEQRAKHPAKKPKSRKSGLPQPEWTSKIYVLATSGFLLQYAGDGNFDRLPEKILQLGKTSAAFASDVIPGRRWVLQILQAANEDGVTLSPRSVFSKFAFRSDSKRSVSSFLLVLESPEEMDSWLVAVRREIEAVGGRKYRPNVGVRKTTDEIVQQLQEKPSRRYLVKRDPNQHSSPRNMHLPSIDASFEENRDVEKAPWRDAETSRMSKRLAATSRHSVDAPSTTHTSISTDQIMLDRLRESMRSSYASTDGKTQITSSEASPVPSPVTANFFPKAVERRQSNGTIHAMSADAIRRRSLQTLSPVVNERQKSVDLQPLPKQPRPRSINSCSTLRSASPATPNFSAPSFSKRYSQGGYTPQMPTPPVSAGRSSQKSPSPQPETVRERPESTIGPLPVPMHVISKSSRSRTSLSTEIVPQPPASTSPPPTSDHLPPLNKTVSAPDRTIPNRFSPSPSKEDHPPSLTRTASPSNRPMSISTSPSLSGDRLQSPSKAAPPPTRPISTLPPLSSTKNHLPPLSKTASPSDRQVPRRFSSLEHSTTPLLPPRHTPAPHPPPTSALPALPTADFSTRPTSTPSTGSRKLRRPASMQVRSASITGLRSISSQAKMHSSYVAFQQKKAQRASMMGDAKAVPVVRVQESTPNMREGEWAVWKGVRGS
ncbi:hypothetical protein MMC30_002925 [Trapelia coarctata]|nr:hypothetical protein [Trapelia coarctata]